MITHVGIENVVGANHVTVFRECEFPTNFQHGSRSDVTGSRLFVTVYEVLRKREVAVGGGLQVIPDVAQFSVELKNFTAGLLVRHFRVADDGVGVVAVFCHFKIANDGNLFAVVREFIREFTFLGKFKG